VRRRGRLLLSLLLLLLLLLLALLRSLGRLPAHAAAAKIGGCVARVLAVTAGSPAALVAAFGIPALGAGHGLSALAAGPSAFELLARPLPLLDELAGPAGLGQHCAAALGLDLGLALSPFICSRSEPCAQIPLVSATSGHKPRPSHENN
jgi:hypothetical protein